MRNQLELGICIVLGVFRGLVDGMNGGMNCVMECISACKHASKESNRSHISISVESWEYTGNESSVVEKEEGRRCSQFSRML